MPGGDPETFKQITRAYEVLSDSEKRATYDRSGEEGLEEGGDGDALMKFTFIRLGTGPPAGSCGSPDMSSC